MLSKSCDQLQEKDDIACKSANATHKDQDDMGNSMGQYFTTDEQQIIPFMEVQQTDVLQMGKPQIDWG